MTTPAKKTPAKKTPAKKAPRQIKSPNDKDLSKFVGGKGDKIPAPSATGGKVNRLTLDLDEVDHQTIKLAASAQRMTMAKWVRAKMHSDPEFQQFREMAKQILGVQDADDE